ncbi:methionine ABC transporter ATP-binding protein [Moraxella atlantae]|uniref:Methionine ABC transporter ATP-binding protein n=2 Tax=Faucicola atlantae TaxID=34059 RepID=A0A1B8QE33_9GAMM|nr:methionine ABC transporter permease [Moraxella atlantae]OBX79890.1 methionine ABC transporter ATP-binding protein [Moraxella atlantae]OPH37573.1 methionine ABC transporter ATP-binding protein [Moraxella atlantae]
MTDTLQQAWQTASANLWAMRDEIWQAFWETLVMLGISSAVSIIGGLLVGVALFMTSKNQLAERAGAYTALGGLTNLIRAFPFVILMIVLIPLTRLLAGTTIGPVAASVALSLAGLFYFARLVEQNLRDVPRGVIEAAQAMGASHWTIVRHVLLNESRASLVLSATTLMISLLSYSAAAGMIGGGGLGDLAIRYGYNRYQNDVMIFMVILLVLMVVVIQTVGNLLAAKLDKR